MKVVYKYELPRECSDTILSLPKNAEILCVQNQFNRIQMWALIDETAPLERRKFVVTYTGPGNCVSDGALYLGTVMFDGGGYVQHVFEEPW